MNVLVPNLGSTSLKYQILQMPEELVLARKRMERVQDYREAVTQIQTGNITVDAVAFKTVHGGPKYRGTFIVDAGVIAALEEFLPAAPAHNSIYLTAIRAFSEKMPGTPLVAAFETEFHRSLPGHASAYGVPSEWRDSGIARYGFHGASHQYVGERTAQILARPQAGLRIVSCHLGGSSSLCAIDRGRSMDTTMGFSPQSGLENATRHGDLDAFAVLFMMERNKWSVNDARRQLSQEGGLAGLSGIAGGDVRDLEEAARGGNSRAALALAVFAYHVRKTIGAYAAAMGGMDAVTFTGGIGENSSSLRAACCAGLEFLGLHLDKGRNEQEQGDRLVSSPDSRMAVLAITTNEELIVARRAYRALTPAR